MKTPHPESDWTHSLCANCMAIEMADRWKPEEDERVETCCRCKQFTLPGFYFRKRPEDYHHE